MHKETENRKENMEKAEKSRNEMTVGAENNREMVKEVEKCRKEQKRSSEIK